MNSRRRNVLVRTLLSICFVVFTPFIRSQVKQPARLDRESLLAAAREIMTTARYCALITLDSNGRPHARTMDPFPPAENMVVWLGSNAKSRKVAEIRRHHRVTLYYFVRDDQAYVTIAGRARIVQDAAAKITHWKDEWKDFYPDGRKNYLLIEVIPERLELISVKQGIIGDSITWTPPAVRFRHRKLKP
jgi:general stress protein 26